MKGLGRPRFGPWVPHWRSCTSLAAAELSQSLLDASRVAVDNLVQAEHRRTAGGRGRQREPWGTLLWGTAEENKEPAPVFTKLTVFLTTLFHLFTFNLFSVLKSRCFWSTFFLAALYNSWDLGPLTGDQT